MTKEKEYWESICVPYDEVIDQKDKHINRWKLRLSQVSLPQLRSINNAFFKVKDDDDSSKLIANMAESEHFIDFVLLQEFKKGRTELLDEYFRKPVFYKTIDQLDFAVSFLPLLKVFRTNPEYLIDALLYCEYKKKQKGDVLLVSPKWTKQDTKLFLENLRSLKVKVAKRYKGKRFLDIRNFSDGESRYFVFQRQKKQKVTRTFARNVSFIGKSDLFIKISEDGALIEARCGDRSLSDMAITHLSSICKKKLFFSVSKPLAYDVNKKIKEVLTTVPDEIKEGDLIVEQAHIRRTISTPRNRIKVGRKGGDDIRNTLSNLQNQNICDLSDKSNILSFHVRYDGQSIGIELIEDEEGAFKFDFTKSDIPNRKIVDLGKKIGEEWGIEIGALYSRPLEKAEKMKLFDDFLDFDGQSQLTEEKKKLLQELIDNKIVISNTRQLWRCMDTRTHTFAQSHNKCPDCGGDLYLQKEYDSCRMNYFGIKSWIRKLLDEVFGKDNVKEKTRKYRNDAYSVFSVLHAGETYHVFIDTGKNINKMISYFKRSIMPTLIISVFRPIKGDIDENIFSNKVLHELYFDDAKRALMKSLTELSSKYAQRTDLTAANSKQELATMLSGNNSDYTDTDLEDDVFNIMKYLFRTGEKWGKDKTSSTIPEAVIGYSTYHKKRKRGYKLGKVSFIWDCKYRKKAGTYQFNRAEIDKARRYIKQANDSNAINGFSGKLNAYLTFCNSVNPTQYKNFSDALYRTRSWKGSVVLFELPALLKLYDFAKSEPSLLETKFHLFLALFSKLIERPENNVYVTIDDAKIDELIRTIKASNLPQQLDVKALQETFELDEIR